LVSFGRELRIDEFRIPETEAEMRGAQATRRRSESGELDPKKTGIRASGAKAARADEAEAGSN
jgi:hypothetical protein